MTEERYAEAEQNGQLTDEEVKQGWHFCLELDGALVNHRGMSDKTNLLADWCRCLEGLEDDETE